MKHKTAKELVEVLELLLNEDKTVVSAKSPHKVQSILKAQKALKKAKKEITEDTPPKGGKGLTHYVDIPRMDGVDYLNVETFTKRSEALKFAKERFGADDDGKISLLSVS